MYKVKGFLSEEGAGWVVADAESLKTARAKAKGMRVEISDAHGMPVPEAKTIGYSYDCAPKWELSDAFRCTN